MTQTTKRKAVRAWAETLRSGLGLVRFSELPQPAFEQLLDGATREDQDLHFVIAEHATSEGLDQLEAAYRYDGEFMAVVRRRRSELRRAAPPVDYGLDNVVQFPGTRTQHVNTNPVAPSSDPATHLGQAVGQHAAAFTSEAAAKPGSLSPKLGWRGRAQHLFARVLNVFDEELTAFDEPERDSEVVELTLAPVPVRENGI